MDAKTLCMGVLTLGESSGYEIKKSVEEGPFSHFHHTSFGSIYPALRKLRDKGFVTCREVAQDGRPDKKVYGLTESGWKAFAKALAGRPERDHFRADTITFLFFAHLMDPNHRRAVFNDYVAHLKKLLSDMEEWDLTDAPAGQRFVYGLGLEYYRMSITYWEANGALLFEPDGEKV